MASYKISMTVSGHNEYFLVACEINMEWQSLQKIVLQEASREAEEALLLLRRESSRCGARGGDRSD